MINVKIKSQSCVVNENMEYCLCKSKSFEKALKNLINMKW